MPILTKTPWFGPKRVGWGLRPIAWQGWAVTIAFFGGLILVAQRGLAHINHKYIILALLVAYLGIAALTSERAGPSAPRNPTDV